MYPKQRETLGAILCRYQTKGAEVSSALFNTFGSSFGWDTKIHSARFRNGCFVQCAVPSLSSSAQPVKSIKIQPQLPVVVQTGGGQSLPMATTGPVPLNMWPHVTAVLHCMGYFDFSLSLTVMHSEHLESSWPLGSRAQHGICETARRNGIFLDPQVEASMLWDCLRLATDVLPCLRFYIYYIIYIFHIFLSNPFGLKEIERNTIQAAMASDGRCSWSRVIPQGEHPLPYEVSMASLLKTSSLLWYITFMSFTNNELNTIYIYIHIQIYTYVYPSLSLCLSFCLSIKLSIYVSVYLSILSYLILSYLILSIYLSIYLRIYIYICIYIYIYMHNTYACMCKSKHSMRHS